MLTEKIIDNNGFWDSFDWSAHLLPDCTDRSFWDGVDSEIASACAEMAERLINEGWPALSASLYMGFATRGNRLLFETPYFNRRMALSIVSSAELMENKGRLIPVIADMAWSICEESSWVLPAHNTAGALPDTDSPELDLFSAETGALIGGVLRLLGPKLEAYSPRVTQRMERECVRRIALPFLARDNYPWMGFVSPKVNNWNPWVYSNVIWLMCALPLDTQQKIAAVKKAAAGVDVFIDSYGEDGACDEGPCYWKVAAGSMFDLLETLFRVSGGKIDVFGHPKIRNMMRYIAEIHIHERSYATFADSHQNEIIPPYIPHGYARLSGDRSLTGYTAFLARDWARTLSSREDIYMCQSYSINRYIRNILAICEMKDCDEKETHKAGYWSPGVQVAVARAGGGAAGLTLAAKGGHNDERHNHNDVGSFNLYLDGEPVLIDAGVGEYTAKTFGENRYDIWSMQSGYHNLPTIGGFMQRAGSGEETGAYDAVYADDGGLVSFGINIDRAYPPGSGLASWRREYEFRREGAGRLVITERYAFKQAGNSIISNFICCNKPSVSAAQVVFYNDAGDGVRMSFDEELLEPLVEAVPLEDSVIRRDWQREALYRVSLQARRPVGVEGEICFVFEASL